MFLALDFKNNKQVAAFYNEVVMEIPQYPTTCFSNSPDITPMWAHYAHNSKGFVIEIDENELKKHVEDANLVDVTYQDEPRQELQSTLDIAMYRGKPRDMMFLRRGVMHSAYFTKKVLELRIIKKACRIRCRCRKCKWEYDLIYSS